MICNFMQNTIEKKVHLELLGIDGNAWSIMGAFRGKAKKEGWSEEEIRNVLEEARSGDYSHLLQTIQEHCV